MKTTYYKFFEFLKEGSQFLNSVITPATETQKEVTGKDTKLGYAIEKVIKQNKNVADDFNAEVQDIRIDNAATDPTTKVILTEPDLNFKFTAAGLKKCNKELRALNDKEISVQTYTATDVHELSEMQKEIFAGFVIKQEENLPQQA